MRLGILTSHPIQYQAPLFRALAKVLDLQVFFCHRQSAEEQGRAGFDVAFDWDVDLLSGYQNRFVKNVSARPGVNHFGGCDTPGIKEVIRAERFDAFIVSGWHLKSYWQASRACRRASVPVLVRGDSQLHTPRSLLKRWVKELAYRPLLRQFDGFLFVGQRNREYLEHYGVPERKMFFAPHFVDNERFATQAEAIRGQRSDIRRQWGIPDDAFCALFCGKFIPKKRPLDLIKAAQLLLSSHPELKPHLVFVGSGELGAEMRAACNVVFDAEENHSALRDPRSAFPNASFAGFLNQAEISKAYVAVDVLVLPSDSETWGLVVNEAMACGLPAIVSDAVGCAPDLIDEGLTGFTFPVGDVEALGKQLQQIAAMREAVGKFPAAIGEKMRVYSINTAVEGTVRAMSSISELCGRQNKGV